MKRVLSKKNKAFISCAALLSGARASSLHWSLRCARGRHDWSSWGGVPGLPPACSCPAESGPRLGSWLWLSLKRAPVCRDEAKALSRPRVRSVLIVLSQSKRLTRAYSRCRRKHFLLGKVSQGQSLNSSRSCRKRLPVSQGLFAARRPPHGVRPTSQTQ